MFTVFTYWVNFTWILDIRFQMMGTFALFSIEWPDIIIPDLLQFFQLFMFDFDIIQWECALNPDMVTKYFFRAILPGLVVLSYSVIYVLARMVGRPLLLPRVINSTGTLLQVLFMSIAMNSFVPFICYSHIIPDDSWSMQKYPAVLCSSDKHWAMVGMGVVAVLLTVSMLGSVAYLTLSAPAMSAADDKFLLKYKFLFFRFRSDRYYFNGIFLLRNFAIGVVPALSPNDVAVQTTLMLLITTTALCVQMSLWPWREWMLNWCDAVVLSTMGIISACAMSIINPSFFNKGSVDTMVMFFCIAQLATISSVVFYATYKLIVFRGRAVVSEAHRRWCADLCNEMQELAKAIIAMPASEQELYSTLPSYDLSNLRAAVGLLSKIYGMPDSSTGTKRLNLGIRQVTAAIHMSTSKEAQQNAA